MKSRELVHGVIAHVRDDLLQRLAKDGLPPAGLREIRILFDQAMSAVEGCEDNDWQEIATAIVLTDWRHR